MRDEQSRFAVLLDAMGVLYNAGDDVAELLVPFILKRRPETPISRIESAYLAASLGELSAAEFWRVFDLPEVIEDAYLQEHSLRDGATEFLDWARQQQIEVACLSNDVGRWSEKLRSTFKLTEKISTWVISGDVGVRKPDPKIYQMYLDIARLKPDRVLFVDDRIKNVQAAARVGLQTALFAAREPDLDRNIVCCENFNEVQDLCRKLWSLDDQRSSPIS
jgi:HAD superfamily hydrolase (TIGR01509 family)